MTTSPKSVVLNGKIYSLTDTKHKICLDQSSLHLMGNWYRGQHGVHSWLFQSPKKQWFQVTTHFQKSVEAKLLSEMEALLELVQCGQAEQAKTLFGKESLVALEG